jgi:hypothetical protein
LCPFLVKSLSLIIDLFSNNFREHYGQNTVLFVLIFQEIDTSRTISKTVKWSRYEMKVKFNRIILFHIFFNRINNVHIKNISRPLVCHQCTETVYISSFMPILIPIHSLLFNSRVVLTLLVIKPLAKFYWQDDTNFMGLEKYFGSLCSIAFQRFSQPLRTSPFMGLMVFILL